MMDGFLGYKKVSIQRDDRENTSFTTNWGTFMYYKMPFGLMNAWGTFQREMNIYFIRERDKFIFIYLDDMIIYSKLDDDYFSHLKQTFNNCRKFG